MRSRKSATSTSAILQGGMCMQCMARAMTAVGAVIASATLVSGSN
jgi:hypothetical protein